MAASTNALHQQLDLYVSQKEYTLVPRSGARTLTIQRRSGELIVNAPNTRPPAAAQLASHNVYGIIGIITLVLADYLVVLTGREHRGKLLHHDIYRATDFKIYRLSPDDSVQYNPVEAHLMGLLKSHLANGMFWCSYTWDLTRRLQTQWQSQRDDFGKPLWEVADDRFFWNKYLQTRLIEATKSSSDRALSPYILPLMYGTFDARNATVKGSYLSIWLISRRSRYRAGTRYFRRGIDNEGHVANFNETEQILAIPKSSGAEGSSLQFSFVQIRGSVPLFWAEVNTMRYKPDLQVMEIQNSANAMKLHFDEQRSIYGSQSLVNLVNQKGHEQPVKEAYEKFFQQLHPPDVKYQYFDFHNECRNMRWDRISVLIDAIEPELKEYGYFQYDPSLPDPVKLQTGVVRTNCMDNLDRTNVSQAAMAKWTIKKQLEAAGIITTAESVDQFPALNTALREMWADHADLVSKAYSGTGALKTDFTRTGKRTKAGALQDLNNSIMRYLKNNYFDGARQDAYDLFTGAWRPRRGIASMSLIQDSRPLVLRSMPYVAWFSVFMVCAGMTLPRSSSYSLSYYFLLWITVFSLAMAFIYVNGIEYVNWPRLNRLDDIINYDGPGFRGKRSGRGLGHRSVAAVGSGKVFGDKRKRAASHVNEIEMGTKKRVD